MFQCDGQRPSCLRCGASNRQCLYTTAGRDIARLQSDREHLESLEKDTRNLRLLFQALLNWPYEDAERLLMRVREESVADVVAYMGLDRESS